MAALELSSALRFRCLAAGPTLDEMQENALAEPSVRALLDSEPWRVAAEIFARRAAPVLDDLADAELLPDLFVHDAYELAGPILAARRDVPWVTHALRPRWPAFLEEAAAMPPAARLPTASRQWWTEAVAVDLVTDPPFAT